MSGNPFDKVEQAIGQNRPQLAFNLLKQFSLEGCSFNVAKTYLELYQDVIKKIYFEDSYIQELFSLSQLAYNINQIDFSRVNLDYIMELYFPSLKSVQVVKSRFNLDDVKENSKMFKMMAVMPSTFFYLYWKVLFHSGQLIHAQIIEDLNLQYLYYRKLVKDGLSFLYDVESKFGSDKRRLHYKINFLLMNQDYNSIATVIRSIGHDKEMEDFINTLVLGDSGNEWKKAQFVFEIYLENKFKKYFLARERFSINDSKDFLEDLYDYIIRFPNESFGTYYCLKYGMICLRSLYVSQMKQFSSRQKNIKTSYVNKKREISTLLKAIESVELSDYSMDISVVDEVDFGTDLIHGKTMKEYTVQKLERDIRFLQNAGLQDDAQKFLERLKMLDENNTLIHELDKQGTLSQVVNGELLPRILLGLDDYSMLYGEAKQFEKSFRRGLSRLSLTGGHAELHDLFVMSFTFHFMDACNDIIDMMEKNIEKYTFKQKISVTYLKITVLMECGLFKEALIRIEFMIKNLALNEEESITFMYLKAVCLIALDRLDAAKSMLLSIDKVIPNYRLTRKFLDDLKT